MTVEHLVAEGRRLARPVVPLVARGSKPVAFWRGTPVVAPPKGRLEHWLSVDCAALPAGVSTTDRGWLSLFTDQRSKGGVVVVDAAAQAPRKKPAGATPLFVEHGVAAIPPIDALFGLGDERVQAWRDANGWGPDDAYNDNFPDRAIVDGYQRVMYEEWPFYRSEDPPHVQLGGWHMPWPEDDVFDVTRRLAVWTIAESEPWVEAFAAGDGFEVVQRVT